MDSLGSGWGRAIDERRILCYNLLDKMDFAGDVCGGSFADPEEGPAKQEETERRET